VLNRNCSWAHLSENVGHTNRACAGHFQPRVVSGNVFKRQCERRSDCANPLDHGSCGMLEKGESIRPCDSSAAFITSMHTPHSQVGDQPEAQRQSAHSQERERERWQAGSRNGQGQLTHSTRTRRCVGACPKVRRRHGRIEPPRSPEESCTHCRWLSWQRWGQPPADLGAVGVTARCGGRAQRCARWCRRGCGRVCVCRVLWVSRHCSVVVGDC
jgi:hypothetical protein